MKFQSSFVLLLLCPLWTTPAFSQSTMVGAAAGAMRTLGVKTPQQPPAGGSYPGPGDIVIHTPCPNTPCGAPSYEFTDSCLEIASPMKASELFRPDSRQCWLPQGSPLAFWRDQFSFRRCSFDELVARVNSGQVVPDVHGNVVVTLGSGEVLPADCSAGSAHYAVPNGQMITVAQSGWLNGEFLQGSVFPNCNTPLPIKLYLRKIFPNGSETCFPLTGAAIGAGNPLLPHGATILEHAFSYWIGPAPTASAECFQFELLVEFDYQCLRGVMLRWDTQMPDPMWSGERLLAVRVLTCDPCGVPTPGSGTPGEGDEEEADFFHYVPGDTVP